MLPFIAAPSAGLGTGWAGDGGLGLLTSGVSNPPPASVEASIQLTPLGFATVMRGARARWVGAGLAVVVAVAAVLVVRGASPGSGGAAAVVGGAAGVGRVPAPFWRTARYLAPPRLSAPRG